MVFLAFYRSELPAMWYPSNVRLSAGDSPAATSRRRFQDGINKMRRLTIQQAEAEAKWRWGSLFVRGFARCDETLKRAFQVGTSFFGSVRVRGQGTSWEGAFSDAARQTNVEPGETIPIARESGRTSRPSADPVAGPITTARESEGRQRL